MMEISSQLISVKQGTTEINLELLDLNTSSQPSYDCLIILNNRFDQAMLSILISSARRIILADGGANRLYDSPFRNADNIQAVIGDLDSITEITMEYYRNRNVNIIKVNDQDSNDFEKAVVLARERGFTTIVCLGVLGCRIDQELACLSSIERFAVIYPELNIVALGESSLMFLAKPQRITKIKVGKRCILKESGMVCFGKASVTTTGFKWNLGVQHGLSDLIWGTLVSSSNQILAPAVTIQTTSCLFFTIELNFSTSI